MNTSSILDHFSTLEDPRQSWKVLYPLPEVLLVVLCGVMAGADDFVEIERWGRRKLDFLRRFLPFKDGISSHDTLNDVMNALPGDLFCECFTNWVSALRDDDPDIVAIDGKTSRRAHARNGCRLHLISAWASRQRLVLGQEPCDEKENEISAIPRLLERLELTGALVTIDAMGCQHDIASALLAKGADYLLALKGNQKSLFKEVALFFDVARDLDAHTTTDADHGRIETRTASVCHAVDWLNADRAAPGEPRFAGLTTIGMLEAEVEKDGQISRSRRFYISSAHLIPKEFIIDPFDLIFAFAGKARFVWRSCDRKRTATQSSGRENEVKWVNNKFLWYQCCPAISRRTRPLGHRKSPALGDGCRLPRRPDAASNPKRPCKHGPYPTHRT